MFKNILKWGGNYLIIELKLLISARVTPPEAENFAILEEKTLEIAHISYYFLFILKMVSKWKVISGVSTLT